MLAALWFAAGQALAPARREALLEMARHEIASAGWDWAGCTAPEDGVLVLRLLAERVEPALALLSRVWSAWRQEALTLAPCAPRICKT